MYGSMTVTGLPAAGVGTAAMYAASGPESAVYAALAAFTILAAVKAAGRMLPKFHR